MSENNNLNTIAPSDDIYANFIKYSVKNNNLNSYEVDEDLVLSKEEISDIVQKFFGSPCSKCGKCCTDVLMASPYEIERIKKYIKKHNIKPVNRNTIFDKSQKNICPFLNKDKTCSIYPVRLEMCEKFYCNNNKLLNRLNSYKDVEVISMMQTFFPDEYMTNLPFDLTYERYRLKMLKEKIYNES